MVLDDLNLIIRDIREFHKKDSESAPQTTVADELKENLEAVENFNQRKRERLSTRGKNGKGKPLLHGLLDSM